MSKSFVRTWKTYFEDRVDGICERWVELIGMECEEKDDSKEWKELQEQLSVSQRTGEMPCAFSKSGARKCYLIDRLKRRSLVLPLILLVMSKQSAVFERFLTKLTDDEQSLKVASFGCGPGFEIVGLELLQRYLGGGVKSRVDVRLFDYEAGWEEMVLRAPEAADNEKMTVSFARCDINLGVEEIVNSSVVSSVKDCDVVIFPFVVVENMSELRNSGFAFLIGMLETIADDSVLIIVDSQNRHWNEVVDQVSSRMSCTIFHHIARLDNSVRNVLFLCKSDILSDLI